MPQVRDTLKFRCVRAMTRCTWRCTWHCIWPALYGGCAQCGPSRVSGGLGQAVSGRPLKIARGWLYCRTFDRELQDIPRSPSTAAFEVTMRSHVAQLAFLFISLAGFTLALGQTQGGGDSKPIIVSVTGNWINASTRQPVKFGQAAKDNDCLYGEKEATVVVKRSGELVPYSCNAPSFTPGCDNLRDDRNKTCSVKIGVKPASANQGFLSRLGDSVWSRLQEDPYKYMIAASRGLEAEFAEGVAPLAGSQLDLSAVFKAMDSGDYWVVLTPVSGNGKSSRPLHLAYKHGMPALVPSAGIAPGLYNVISVDQGGAPLGTEAWALICGPDTYASASSQFGQLVAASAKWPEEMDSDATRAILRADLDQLSRGAEK
jgi:hypothetical protein